jgi:transposase
MSGTRRRFTDEFKREAVALLESSGRPLGQIAQELGIQPSMLRHWRRRQSTPGGTAALSSKQTASPLGSADQAAEIARLRKENDRLRMERDILKKTVSIFSEPPK